jgi:hypothetical protein
VIDDLPEPISFDEIEVVTLSFDGLLFFFWSFYSFSSIIAAI